MELVKQFLIIMLVLFSVMSNTFIDMEGNGFVHYQVNNQTFEWTGENGSLEMNVTIQDNETEFDIKSENGVLETKLKGDYEINEEKGSGFFHRIYDSILIIIRGVVR